MPRIGPFVALAPVLVSSLADATISANSTILSSLTVPKMYKTLTVNASRSLTYTTGQTMISIWTDKTILNGTIHANGVAGGSYNSPANGIAPGQGANGSSGGAGGVKGSSKNGANGGSGGNGQAGDGQAGIGDGGPVGFDFGVGDAGANGGNSSAGVGGTGGAGGTNFGGGGGSGAHGVTNPAVNFSGAGGGAAKVNCHVTRWLTSTNGLGVFNSIGGAGGSGQGGTTSGNGGQGGNAPIYVIAIKKDAVLANPTGAAASTQLIEYKPSDGSYTVHANWADTWDNT